MAGLLAARVASGRFERVTLIERDISPATPDTRKGVPQGRHAHVLLARGEQILSRLFPGITADLVAGGAFAGDMGATMRWFQFGGYKKQHTWGHNTFIQTRPYLEWHVRRRVLALPNVTMLPNTSVSGLQRDGDTITGVELQNAEPIAADFTIDCTGRGSAAPRWLKDMGFDAPPESAIEVNVGYASRYFRRTAGQLQGASLLVIHPKPPAERRSATLFPIEGDRWICTLAGWLGDHPPTDPAGFLEFAKNLPAPDVHRVISQAEPLSDAVPHRFPANLRRHYERLSRFPERYLVLGDAVCSFNPVYGQGMTSAALQAETLDRHLAKGIDAGLARRHFRDAARIIDVIWKLAAGEDFRYPEVTGPKMPGTDLGNRYVSLIHRAVMRDQRVYGDFLSVLNLLESPEILFRPVTVWRVLRANMGGA
jgi:2-polyprenyl-6-methoxyphenol hydroxylase-like FAD-dependent oxidoreductase